jgi:hypothetical protein
VRVIAQFNDYTGKYPYHCHILEHEDHEMMRQFWVVEECSPADLNGDGEVKAFDLAILLGDWGPCDDPCTPGDPADTCAADLNGDCTVEAFDLAILLGDWGGPCAN